ncbi:hypothetical protein MHYP_G00201620 [Metynnis hypsauchen]
MGKCVFNSDFRSWLQAVSSNLYEAHCKLCKKTIQLGTLGVKALESHAKAEKHQLATKSLQRTQAITQFCASSPPSSLSSVPGPAGLHRSIPSASANDIRATLGSSETSKSEVLWILHSITKHLSYNSSSEISSLFRAMFPDSNIAKTFTCGPNKIAYIARFGLADFIKRELIRALTGPYVLMFDESFNSTTKSKQLDLHVRFWSNGYVQSRYMGSHFMGHGTAQDLLKLIKEALHQLDRSRLVSVSMDGPNVNWKLMDLLQHDHAEKYGGAHLVSVGSCGLHTLHNAFRAGFSMWHVDKILKAMHTLFHNVPARREDYVQVTKSIVFPKPFCGHRWLENLPVVERSLAVWPSLMLYVDAVLKKQLPNPKTASFDTIEAALKDPLIIAKMHFFMTVARTFHPFMKKYQNDEPVMPFLGKDLAELIKSLLRRCVKREVLMDIIPLQLTKLDLADKNLLLLPQRVDIGLGAEATLKDSKIAELKVLEFRRDCMQGLSNIVRKVQEKSPLKYATVRQMECLDPSLMFRDPDKCKNQMKSLVQTFLKDKQLTGGVPAGDAIVQQFESFLSVEVRNEEFLTFQPFEKRLDTFLHERLSRLYPAAWDVCHKLLLLSHGQASVERGFSVNKEVEAENMQEDTIVTHRLICDYVTMHGGVTQVPLTKELLASVGAARSKYRLFLDQERIRKEKESQSQKRKLTEQSLEDLKKRKKSLEDVSTCLAREADSLAEEAEGKAGSKMAQLLSKSNALRRAYKEKLAQVKILETEMVTKKEELRHM